ncbi:uncharacterized protein LOC118736512 [Rhagoletis pomonella]|uniref:uncharacterized protein LOC118736512 n=1 Tax=Rhagoletis pomonella TaxID=28610 RepID=UPI001783073B|nr:uncharacterized protein LOC118736512 [Rhagoletis pomonella]
MNEHPDRQEFKYSLRSYILGFNEGALSDDANVSIDDTPDLELESNSLTGIIFNKISLTPDAPSEEFADQEEHELESLENDGLENLAGYICHRLHSVVPDIRVEGDDDSFTWVNQLTEGGVNIGRSLVFS